MEYRELAVDEVYPNPDQPRRHFDEDALRELAQSILDQGQLQAIMVRPNGDGYEIVHGERRWRAHKLAELPTIHAEIRELTDAEAYTLSVIENEQREDLSPIETARAIRTLMDTQDLTQEAVAAKIAKGRSWVAQKLRLLNLPPETQSLVGNGGLTEGHARQLLKLKTAAMDGEIDTLAKQAIDQGWSVSRLTTEVDVTILDRDAPVAELEPTDADELDLADLIRLAYVAGALCVTRHNRESNLLVNLLVSEAASL